LTEDHQVHPADALAQHLDRVTGLVRTLGDLYAPHSESFATGNGFIAHGLVAVSTLLNDAQGALENLHQLCDLRINPTPPLAETEDGPVDSAAADEEPLVFPVAESKWHENEPVIAETVAEKHEAPTPRVQTEQDDQFAQSYLELLRKLTAAEVFAAEQQALAPPGSGQNLLPLLRSLREEFQKLHKVA
jgi:hypothetical protein